MSAEDLVSRLERVRQVSRGNWSARCPAHPDKNPSLSISEAEDGRVLVKCFAGCSVDSIVAAVGLDMGALFPAKPVPLHEGRAKPARLRFDARAVLAAVAGEIDIVRILAGDIVRGPLLPADLERLKLACERLHEARSMVDG